MDRNPELFACSATLLAPTEQVFDLFTNQIGDWWPIPRLRAGRMERKIVIEPRVNGRVYETYGRKSELIWGTVAAYAAPQTLIIDLELDPEFQRSSAPRTSVEIFFMQQKDGSTHLTVVHAELHGFGVQEQARERFAAGWRDILDAFTRFAESALVHPAVQPHASSPGRVLPPGLY